MLALRKASGSLRIAEAEEIQDVIDAALDAAADAGSPLTDKNTPGIIDEQATFLGLRLDNGQRARAVREAIRSYEYQGE